MRETGLGSALVAAADATDLVRDRKQRIEVRRRRIVLQAFALCIEERRVSHFLGVDGVAEHTECVVVDGTDVAPVAPLEPPFTPQLEARPHGRDDAGGFRFLRFSRMPYGRDGGGGSGGGGSGTETCGGSTGTEGTLGSAGAEPAAAGVCGGDTGGIGRFLATLSATSTGR